MRVDVEYDEHYWYPDDGGQVWIAGFQVVDRDSGRYLARESPELAALGLRVAGVAGAGAHHAEALATDAVAPGGALELRRDPDNPHDPNAIQVHPAGDGDQVGWVPRELAAELAPELDAGRPWAARRAARAPALAARAARRPDDAARARIVRSSSASHVQLDRLDLTLPVRAPVDRARPR